MKKLIYCALALAAGLFATSCMQENLEPVAQGNTVTYTVEIPDVLLTKAIGDDVTKVDELVYEVYRTKGERMETFTEGVDNLLYHKTAVINNGTAIISLEFVNNQNFTVLFWAHTKDNGVYDASDLTDITITSPDVANNVNAQAFVGRDFVVNSVSDSNRRVTLKRPVSQLNIGTTEASLTAFNTPITLSGSSVKVKGLSTSYNVAALSAGQVSDVEYEYTETEVPSERLVVGTTKYIYVGMNYVGFAANEGSTVKVSYAINTSEGEITKEISNVPVKPNYRTNIVGNLITSTSSYTIELDEAWGTDDNGTMEVINNGVVRNVNGDYEVTNAEGLAFAMNNLFALGGNFYLTEAEYDLTNYTVVVPTITENLNIYGETPVVTRSATTVAGVTIKGLDGAFLPKVDEGSKVTVSGVTLEGDDTVLVGENDGTVIVYETTADTLVVTGNDPVAASAVSTIDELTAALDAGAEEIKLVKDIEATEFISISRSVTINGNGHKLISSASRIIRFQKNKGIEVTFNDLHGVSTAKFVYGSIDSIRGFSVDGEVHDMLFTLNNCSVDFTDESATDWSYAINLVTSENNTIIINGGRYEGANVINIWGDNHTINIDGIIFNNIYAYNNLYTGCCVRLEGVENKLTVKNSTFNGSHAVPVSEKNEGQNTIILENNIDNTSSKYIDKNGVTYYTVASLDKLQDAINAASTGENVIKFSADITGNATVLQKEGVNLTIDGDRHNFDGKFSLEGGMQGGQSPETLTFKNIDFVHTDGSIDFIWADDAKTLGKRYAHNVTVEDCTFTGTEESVAMRYRQTFNMTVKNVTATGLHSLIQATGGDGLTIDNATVEAKSAVSVGTMTNVLVKNSNFNVDVYGVRANGTAGNPSLKVENTTITAEQPVIVRKMSGAELYSVDLSNVTLNTTAAHQVVFTNGEDDAEYVIPTGTYTLTGGDNFIVYPRDLVVSTAEALKAALKANSPKIYIAADIIISENWDARDAKPSVPVMIDGLGHTLKFTNTIDDKNYFSVFRFENDAVVKNLKFDLSEAVGTLNGFRAISAKTNLTVDNCEFIGNPAVTNTRAVIFGEGQSKKYDATVSITNSTFTNWRRGVTDNENATDIKEISIVGNSFTSADVAISAYDKITFNGNKMYAADVAITSYTASCDVTVQALENSLYPYGTYQIGSAQYKFNEAKVNAQPGFTVTTHAAVMTENELKNAFANNDSRIILGANINLTENWAPVGTLDAPFTGVFDGNGYTISGLKVAETEYAAFIAYAGENTTIKNVTLKDVDINSTKHAAGVVCITGEGLLIDNVTVSGNIVAASYAGGLVHNGANVTVKNSVNNANVSANRAGGIGSWLTVGANLENVANNGTIYGAVGASGIVHGFAGTIKNAVNKGAVTSDNYEAAAGIAGVQKAASTYEYCYNYGVITSTYDDANSSAAGILGQSAGSASTLKYCVNYGKVTAEQSYAAGIAYSLYGTINASYCYNEGTITGADGAGAIAPKAQYGTTDKACYCLNAGVVSSANGTVYQASNVNTSCYYYNGSDLLNVANNTLVEASDALAVLNGGPDKNFFTIEGGKIVVK